jgi:integrase
MERRLALTRHPSGQWCRRVQGKLRYFGTDYEQALRKWYETTRSEGMSIGELAVQWLDWKQAQRLSPRTLEGYEWMARQVGIWFGKGRCPEWIEPAEVQRFLSTVGGPWRIRNALVILKGMISWGDEMGLCGRPRGMGLWKGAPERELRRARRGEESLWRADEVQRLMRGGTSVRCRLMAALGINLGYGVSDICAMPTHVDEEGFVGGPRPKTGVPRLGWMWPETHALWKEHGGLPMGGARSGHLFRQWRKHVEKCGVDVGGRKHYDLRATLRTWMSEEGDVEAARLVMGHESRSVERFYLRSIARERVRSLLQAARTRAGLPR